MNTTGLSSNLINPISIFGVLSKISSIFKKIENWNLKWNFNKSINFLSAKKEYFLAKLLDCFKNTPLKALYVHSFKKNILFLFLYHKCSVIQMVNFFLKCAIFHTQKDELHVRPHLPLPHLFSHIKNWIQFYLFSIK